MDRSEYMAILLTYLFIVLCLIGMWIFLQILNRFDSENILEKLRNSTWPRKLYGDMSKPDEFCGQVSGD